MGYFGGLGSGKGWLKYQFVVEPDLLREILAEAHCLLVITNSRVPSDYGSTDLADYIGAYSCYLGTMFESSEAIDRAAGETYMGLAASLSAFRANPCADTRYKLMDTEEPVVALSPMGVYWYEQYFSTHTHPPIYIGMEMNFPRVISLASDRHEYLYDTAGFPTRRIFDCMKSHIHSLTSPCKIRSELRVHRTTVRITPSMRELMKGHPGLVKANLEVL